MAQDRDETPIEGPRVAHGSAKGHGLGKAALGIPLLAAAGWLGRKGARIPHDLTLPAAVSGERRILEGQAGRLSYYAAGPQNESAQSARPLLLVHSINAAGSAYEVRPIFEAMRGARTVYAPDLPGFGFSDRPAMLYTPRHMTDAVLAMVHEIRSRHGEEPIDALGLSLSSEFLARAAAEHPELFRSVALVSPTGFDRRGPRNGPPGSDRGMPALYKTVTFGPWRRPLFDLLTSRVSIRYFLEKTWGSKAIDEDLLDYDYRTTHQPGAEHAPYSFISGFLFSNDSNRLYESLSMPVWLAHGRRGDFTDYSGTGRVDHRPNWTLDVFDTGALPHFEVPGDFMARYERFLSGHAP